ncbi:MAG: AAA family ATPase, partial [Patescibacteria group bacterium]|nr:AAA family ATPase [Patescibacteria group bacterium]
VERTTGAEPYVARKVLDGRRILEMRDIARKVPADSELRRRAARICAASQPGSPRAPELVRRYVRCGASPRGAQAIVLGAKVHALLAGRSTATADDLPAVAHAALRHRLLLNYEGEAEGIDPDRLVDALLETFRAAGPSAQSP